MSAKVLYYDIETSPLVVHSWGLRDLNVGLSQIVEDPRVLGVGYKWDHERTIHWVSEFHQSRQEMLDQMHAAFDAADIIIGYNSRGFDTPWVQGELAREGYLPPSPFKQVDLYKEAKKAFRFPSHKLQYVSTALGLKGKHDTGGHSLWVKCLEGDERAWAKMARYCRRDVALLPALHHKLLPWIGNHPNLNLFEEPVFDDDGKPIAVMACHACRSTNLQKRGRSVSQTRVYQRYQCQDCGAWPKATLSDPSVKVAATGETR